MNDFLAEHPWAADLAEINEIAEVMFRNVFLQDFLFGSVVIEEGRVLTAAERLQNGPMSPVRDREIAQLVVDRLSKERFLLRCLR